MELLLMTVFMTVLGALTNVLLWIRSWDELTSFEATRTLLLGVIVGVLWYFVRVEHGAPDSVVSFAVGYAARDVVEAIAQRFKPRLWEERST